MKSNNIKFVFPTLKDVAKRAGVSPITVSRVYNPRWSGKVSQTAIDKVYEAAKELGYNANGVARSLNMQMTNIIAVVIGAVTGNFYNEVMHKLVSKIQASGRQALVFVADPTFGMDNIVAAVNYYRVDAIIITSSATKSNIMNYFTNSKIPLILFNREVMNSNASAVWGNSSKATIEIADFLVNNGHRQIGFILGTYETERDESFVKKLEELKMAPVCIYKGEYTYNTGYDAARKILTAPNIPDVVFCSDDNMAMGVMDAARYEFGLKIPQNLSVIGFDDNPTARLKSYDLTTMRQPVDSMIDGTIEIIEELLKNPGKQILKKYDMELIVRSSVKTLNKDVF